MNKGEKTKQFILKHSRALFAKKGFDATKTSEIAKVCDISEATIYKYFESKKALLLACVTPKTELTTSTEDVSHLSLEALIERYVTNLLALIQNNREQFEILFNETYHHPELSTQYVQQIHRERPEEMEIERRIRQGDIHTISDFFLFTVGMISAVLAMTTHKEIHDKTEVNHFTPDMIREVSNFVLYGIKGNKS
ncbi:TetR/AcrR family transcriptional regulator [Tuberibacillus sp. Marseille-P3662]|uniref:TetR/AcrR family transcriptional regulator n=1 Tax=Tuberibacillus sp. Marseille-P3662 TaxID=1965358 RepID=UPI001593FFCD|nr:TetR/AcrR family transcriptional regulator [Tuberibacillus sp. Marseille-P3662]